MTSKNQWMTTQVGELFEAFSKLENKREIAMFFRDVATMREITEMAGRWKAAQLLEEGKAYRFVSKKTGLSTATVTRVANWRREGEGGYKLLLKRLNKAHSHAH